VDSSLYQFPKNDKPYERSWEIYLKDNHQRRMLMVTEKTKVEFKEDDLRKSLHKRLDELLDKLWKKQPDNN
jgi:hypothetical protein